MVTIKYGENNNYYFLIFQKFESHTFNPNSLKNKQLEHYLESTA